MSSRFRDFIEAVRSATDLVDVIGSDVTLAPSGSVLKGLSPFHAETKPSFIVWPDNQTWHDFSNGGGLGGDVFSYLQHRHGLSFKEALYQQAAKAGMSNPFGNGSGGPEDLEREVERRAVEDLFSKAAAYYHAALPTKTRERYFAERYGFTDETVDGLLLGWADGGLQAHFKNDLGIDREGALKTGLFVVTSGGRIEDFFKKRLVFPYWKHGRVVYFIARATEETEDVVWEQAKYKKLLTHSEKHGYVSPSVENAYFYNEDAAKAAEQLLVTEGVTDCISAIQAGIPCISPVTTRFRYRDIEKLLDLGGKAKRFVICNDVEESGAGTAGALETARALHEKGREVRIATLPRAEGVEKMDVNEFLRVSSPEEFNQLLERAPRYVQFLIASIPAETPKAEIDGLIGPLMRAMSHCTPVEQEASIDALVERFKIGRRSVKAMLRASRKEERASKAQNKKRTRVLSELSDAPVSGEHVVPRGWLLRDASEGDDVSIHKVVETKDGEAFHVPVSTRPVVLTAWVKNLTTGNKMIELAWKAGGKWRRATIDREKALDSARIVDALAGRGFPVSSSNRADLVKYLADYEAANVGAMPVRAVSEQMGWVDGRFESFLCGGEVIAPNLTQAETEFRAADEGEAQLVTSIRPRGEFEAWARAVESLTPYPHVMLGVYASLAAPLLELLELPGFAMDWSYRTSSGKSVVLRAAASVWGNPDERSGSSLIQTWNTTLVGFERTASALRNLPVILDDTKTASHPNMVAGILYQATAGHGRTRGSIKGARRVRSWRTVLLSTGERKATDFTKDAGSVVRCLALWGNPFGTVSDLVAATIQKFERAIFRNHGHAGPEFVAWILRQNRDALLRRYDRLHDNIYRSLGDGFDVAIASRIGYAIAVVELAGELAHEALPLPWPYQSPWGTALKCVVEEIKDVDRALEALQAAYDWALGRMELFHGRRDRINPPDRWAGVWKDGEYLAFTGLTLREVLEESKFEFDPIVKQWRERGWLLIDGGAKKRRTKAIRVSGVKGDYYAIRDSALELVAGGDLADGD